MLTVLSVCHFGTLQIDRFHERTGDKCFVNGHYYSEKAPLPALAAIPFYYLVKNKSDLEKDEKGLIGKRAFIVGNLVCGVIPFVFIISLLFLELQKTNSRIASFLLSTFPFYGSFVFLYSGAFLNHLFSAALLLCSYILLHDKRKFFSAGIFAGLAFLSDFPLGIALPIWALQLYFSRKSVKKAAEFMLGFLPALLLLFTFNYFITGNPFAMLYNFVSHPDFAGARDTLGFASIHFTALWQMLFSEFRGLFLYFPILVLIAYFSVKQLLKNPKIIPGNFLVLFACLHYLLISAHEIWWGGACVGPRHLIPVAVLLAFEGIRKLPEKNYSTWLFGLLTLAGFIFSWMAKSTVAYRIDDELEHPVRDGILPLFFEKSFNADNVLTMLWGVPPQTAAYTWLAAFILFVLFFVRWAQKTASGNSPIT